MNPERTATMDVRYAPVDPATLAEHGDQLPFNLDLTDRPTALDAEDLAAIEAATTRGAQAVWRTWSYPGGHRHYLTLDADGTVGPAGSLDADGAMGPAGSLDVATALGYSALLWTVQPTPPVRLATLYDRYDEQTGPAFGPDRPRLDAAARGPVLEYLRGGAPLLATTSTIPDVVDPAAPPLPASFRTDGTWIWAEAVTAYLERYGIAPDPQLLAHLRQLGQPPAVGLVALHRTLAALQVP
jgi:hypothetical protein